ncbi:DUF5304 family protein [Nonomuraea sp. NPDC050783]|uniref:DUF5304 family protein n=1 Tax=Nonomuraea sp. NPDC050783 TaxID=3154634 RepID=UPI003465B481
MTESNHDRDPIGSVADEARKLFESIQGRATRQVGRTVFNSFTGGPRRERDVWEEAVSDHHDEYVCRACPLCRAIAAQRESGREAGADVTGHLVAAGGELFAAFRGALDAFSRPAPRGTGSHDTGSRDTGSRDTGAERRPDDGARRDGVEHIDLG